MADKRHNIHPSPEQKGTMTILIQANTEVIGEKLARYINDYSDARVIRETMIKYPAPKHPQLKDEHASRLRARMVGRLFDRKVVEIAATSTGRWNDEKLDNLAQKIEDIIKRINTIPFGEKMGASG